MIKEYTVKDFLNLRLGVLGELKGDVFDVTYDVRIRTWCTSYCKTQSIEKVKEILGIELKVIPTLGKKFKYIILADEKEVYNRIEQLEFQRCLYSKRKLKEDGLSGKISLADHFKLVMINLISNRNNMPENVFDECLTALSKSV